MARCKFCNENIDWVNIHGKWEPRDRSGKLHRCQHTIDRTATLIPIVSAVCVKCWKPLIGSTNICNCLNPLRIHKREAKKLKLQFLKMGKEKKRALSKEAVQILKCLICENEAVQVGDSVICLTDASHEFLVGSYKTEE
jgi:hypothetical protein